MAFNGQFDENAADLRNIQESLPQVNIPLVVPVLTPKPKRIYIILIIGGFIVIFFFLYKVIMTPPKPTLPPNYGTPAIQNSPSPK